MLNFQPRLGHHNAQRASRRQQRGASALEYIVLAASLIILLGGLASNSTVQNSINTAFTDLFSDAADTGDGS